MQTTHEHKDAAKAIPLSRFGIGGLEEATHCQQRSRISKPNWWLVIARLLTERPAMDLENIEHVVVVMSGNRPFDDPLESANAIVHLFASRCQQLNKRAYEPA